MAKVKNGAVTAAAAIALATTMGFGAANAAYHPADMNSGATITHELAESAAGLNEGPTIFALDDVYPANLVVACDIGGTQMDVGSFEACDLAGGQAISAEI
ncbi:MAG: hypothetical protein AAF414_00925 [Pseudomonadota bacterium]